MRPKVKVSAVVWGEAYIDRFTALALPSFLAPGNLPALADATDLEFLIMTSAAGASSFEGQPAFAHLKRVCRVRFIPIDDLIGSSVYGVTLTLAYTRGIANAGEDMVNTYFVFLNSDFVLADGSLRALLKHISDGRHCILAPSFRANVEDVEPLLEDVVDSDTNTLVMKPREMVRLALQHVHPTTVAKTVNQVFCHSIHPNQLYWWVDESTVLGRFYLIFMLCIRPERVVKQINSYCDYGFVPEMCPSRDIAVLTDSDEFFMLETQRRLQESQHIRLGSLDPAEIARSLAEWTTQEHRHVATYDLLFHSADVPSNIEEAKAEADRYIKDISRRLPRAKDHAFHLYWVSGVEAWQQQLRRLGLSGEAPELATDARGHGRVLSKLNASILRAARVLLIGTYPFVRIWHHDWSDYRIIWNEVCKILSRESAQILFVDPQTPIAAYFPPNDPRITRLTHQEFILDGGNTGPSRQFDVIVLVMAMHDLRATCGAVIERACSKLNSDGELLIIAQNTKADLVGGDIYDDLLLLTTDPSLLRLTSVSASYCGGLIKRVARRAIGRLARLFHRYGLVSTLVVAPALAGLFTINALNNLYMARLRKRSSSVDFCTSVVIRFRKPAAALA